MRGGWVSLLGRLLQDHTISISQANPLKFDGRSKSPQRTNSSLKNAPIGVIAVFPDTSTIITALHGCPMDTIIHLSLLSYNSGDCGLKSQWQNEMLLFSCYLGAENSNDTPSLGHDSRQALVVHPQTSPCRSLRLSALWSDLEHFGPRDQIGGYHSSISGYSSNAVCLRSIESAFVPCILFLLASPYHLLGETHYGPHIEWNPGQQDEKI